MEKPSKRVIVEAFDWSECTNFIEKKYNIKTHDYAGKYRGNPDAPYQDFWHFICHTNDIHNGGMLYLDSYLMDGAEDWQKQILQLYFDEFKEPNRDGVSFWVEW